MKSLGKGSKSEAAPAPTGPADPYAHLIGHSGNLVSKSQFEAMLDQILESEDAKNLSEQEPDYGNHKWKTIQEAIYEDDCYVWRCENCFRQVRVQRNETLAQACAAVNLSLNCGEQIVTDVMES